MRWFAAIPGGATFVRYLGASIMALAVDLGGFLVLLDLGSAPGPASAAAYATGIVAHWVLSTRGVFAPDTVAQGAARSRQKALFVGSALVGLGLTTLVVSSGAALGLDPRIAKIMAVAVSFIATWLLRQRVVFRAAAAA